MKPIFETISPESAGIESAHVQRFLTHLEENGLVMHSVLLLRGEKLFGEFYWKPFDRPFCHRMYSQTKSLVGVAIGLLAEEKKLSLSDRVASFFPDKIDAPLHPYMQAQTIEDMLKMTTCAHPPDWFKTDDPDRTHEYLNASHVVRPSGTIWEYDSPGSQVLSSLVERLSGKKLLDYLREKLFSHMGAFETATILETPNGDSWGDSALVCRPLDMLAFGRFVMNYGTWKGKRLMNESYLRTAASPLVHNGTTGHDAFNTHGYGYQIWRNRMGGFGFHGMGGQFTVCLPEKDFIFVCTGDNQGFPAAGDLIFRTLEKDIVAHLTSPLPENISSHNALLAYGKTLSLRAASGLTHSPLEKELHGKTYLCAENPMKIKRFSFEFDKDSILFRYENAQGEKALRLGRCENHFTKFPQYGYSGPRGGVRTTDGSLYDCAASAAWRGENTLDLRVQIIDRYFGNMNARFSFKNTLCALTMISHAEDFLKEYIGELTGEAIS